MEEAKTAIVTAERWESETPYLVEQIGEFLKPTEDTIILDYGCGAGRLAKELIDKYNCYILGVDISTSMQRLAIEYIDSPKFSVCSPDAFNRMITNGFMVDHVFAVWVLQHCLKVDKIIKNIDKVLKPGGLLYVVNDVKSLIPTKTARAGGWSQDETDVYKLLLEEFTELDYYKLSKEIAPQEIAERSYVSKLKKRNLDEN